MKAYFPDCFLILAVSGAFFFANIKSCNGLEFRLGRKRRILPFEIGSVIRENIAALVQFNQNLMCIAMRDGTSNEYACMMLQ